MHETAAGRIPRWLERLRGGPIVRDLAPYRRRLAAIAAREPELSAAPDSTLRERFRELRGNPNQTEVFALVREAARRTIDLHPYDEQILAGLALTDGRVAEMQTGEGKTLAAVAPIALHALEGRGAHLLTFNDYLARRDAEWMRPIYELLGLRVGAIQEGMSADDRRQAYAADVTYATAKEVGFDTLRASLCRHASERVQRPFHYVIVDEADSILIDEARVPLVIAGDVGEAHDAERQLGDLVERLEEDLHYETDEHRRSVGLTEQGHLFLERELGCGPLIDEPNLELLTEINGALHARVLLRRDVDYIVRDGRIELVDEFTGRVVEDRHLPDGLQAAVEAKEGLRRGARGTILGSITLQHFLSGYPKLAGMTATAQTAAEELREFYGMETVVIPPHRPPIRIDHDDVVFTHSEAKLPALVEEIRSEHATGRPILVGTASVEESESLSGELRRAGVECQVLNARRDDLEAEIVAEAGAVGAVTISTNMAGRGTDIRLGGRDEKDRDRVAGLGGLYVIGTNRHESRRVDDQLRGRAGRQGDPGATRFFISLDDPLIARFGVERLIPERYRPERQDSPIDHPMVLSEIGRAQRIVEGENLDIRRTLTRYTTMVEEQRAQLEDRRERVLDGDLDDLEKQITLACLDRCWYEHLAHIADLRDAIHLVRVARLDPLAEFQRDIIDTWAHRWSELDGQVEEMLTRYRESGGDLDALGLRVPSSTWTYLVSDDPFRDKLMSTISGTAMGVGIVFNFPLVLAWWLYRWSRKRKSE